VKKYDPLWEIVDEKIPLEGAEKDVDTRCPECHVILHVAPELATGDEVECGLCGAPLTVNREGDEVRAEVRF
jgi:uncharacterized paraquat-inducible protein A